MDEPLYCPDCDIHWDPNEDGKDCPECGEPGDVNFHKLAA